MRERSHAVGGPEVEVAGARGLLNEEEPVLANQRVDLELPMSSLVRQWDCLAVQVVHPSASALRSQSALQNIPLSDIHSKRKKKKILWSATGYKFDFSCDPRFQQLQRLSVDSELQTGTLPSVLSLPFPPSVSTPPLLTASLLSRIPVVQNKIRVLHVLRGRREERNKHTGVRSTYRS